jgi:hypothetical protein
MGGIFMIAVWTSQLDAGKGEFTGLSGGMSSFDGGPGCFGFNISF